MKIQFVTDIFGGEMDDRGCHPTLPAGSAQWATGEDGKPESLIFICPCGCKKIRSVPVAGPQAWKWDGNLEAPTLTPSILIIGECGWHGFLTGGNFTTC